jgi:ketopantoate hydroxymethyltransferase
MTQAVTAYRDEVKGGVFPTKENSFIIDNDVLEQVKAKLQ